MRSICNAIHYLKLKVLFFFFWAITEIPAKDFFGGVWFCIPLKETELFIVNGTREENRRQGHTRCIWRFIYPVIFHLQRWSHIPSHCGRLHCHPSAPSQPVLCQYLYGSRATGFLSRCKLGGTHTSRRKPQAPNKSAFSLNQICSPLGTLLGLDMFTVPFVTPFGGGVRTAPQKPPLGTYKTRSCLPQLFQNQLLRPWFLLVLLRLWAF